MTYVGLDNTSDLFDYMQNDYADTNGLPTPNTDDGKQNAHPVTHPHPVTHSQAQAHPQNHPQYQHQHQPVPGYQALHPQPHLASTLAAESLLMLNSPAHSPSSSMSTSNTASTTRSPSDMSKSTYYRAKRNLTDTSASASSAASSASPALRRTSPGVTATGKQIGRPQKLDAHAEHIIREELDRNPACELKQLQAIVLARCNIDVSLSSISRRLKALGRSPSQLHSAHVAAVAAAAAAAGLTDVRPPTKKQAKAAAAAAAIVAATNKRKRQLADAYPPHQYQGHPSYAHTLVPSPAVTLPNASAPVSVTNRASHRAAQPIVRPSSSSTAARRQRSRAAGKAEVIQAAAALAAAQRADQSSMASMPGYANQLGTRTPGPHPGMPPIRTSDEFAYLPALADMTTLEAFAAAAINTGGPNSIDPGHTYRDASAPMDTGSYELSPTSVYCDLPAHADTNHQDTSSSLTHHDQLSLATVAAGLDGLISLEGVSLMPLNGRHAHERTPSYASTATTNTNDLDVTFLHHHDPLMNDHPPSQHQHNNDNDSSDGNANDQIVQAGLDEDYLSPFLGSLPDYP
ncbi:hypothetical protein PYCC9005_004767 [Savitreella phatthalungensis]